MLEVNSGIEFNVPETGHNLRSYQYTAKLDEGVGTEWGMVNYTKANLDYLTNLFQQFTGAGSLPDGLPAPSPTNTVLGYTFTYYNFILQDFIPQRLNVFDVKEMSNNYNLDFIYNYYDVNYETFSNQVPEPYLPNHYCIRQHNEVSFVGFEGQAFFPYQVPFYGDDVNELAASSLATLAGSISAYQYDSDEDLGLADQGFNFVYNPNNYYYNHSLNFESYSRTNDYLEFRNKTRNCFMSFNRRVDKSSAPFYTKLRINYRSIPTNRIQTGLNLEVDNLIGYQHKMRPYMFYFYDHITRSPFVDTNVGAISRSYITASGPLPESQVIQSPQEFGNLRVKLFGPLEEFRAMQATGSFLEDNEIALFDNVSYTSDDHFGDRPHLVDSIFPNLDYAENSVRTFFSEGFDWSIFKPGLGKYIRAVPDVEPIIVCFKIEKFLFGTDTPLQTFYLDHDAKQGGTNGENFLEFLDSQQKYGAKYTYKVSAYCRLDTPTVKVVDMFYSDANGNLYSVFANGAPTDHAHTAGDLQLGAGQIDVLDFLRNFYDRYIPSPYDASVGEYGTLPRYDGKIQTGSPAPFVAGGYLPYSPDPDAGGALLTGRFQQVGGGNITLPNQSGPTIPGGISTNQGGGLQVPGGTTSPTTPGTTPGSGGGIQTPEGLNLPTGSIPSGPTTAGDTPADPSDLPFSPYAPPEGQVGEAWTNPRYDMDIEAYSTAPDIIGEIPMTSPIEPNKIYIKTEVVTRAEFMEIELFEDSITVLEPIFTPPEVKFFNQNGKPNDLLVRAQLNYNALRTEYVPITGDDTTSIQEYLQYFHPDGTYDFRTINGEGQFELRRLSSPPKSYADFEQAYVHNFTGDATGAIYSIVAHTINKIKPNKKYYYMLRARNNHGIYSNPTTVYEVELLQDSDDTFIIVEEYQFKNNLPNNYSKSGKRYLQLKVSNLQGLINENSVEFQDAATAEEITNVSLGPTDLESKVWGRTFKIRLTSEKTGKKIDFNVSFKHTDEPN